MFKYCVLITPACTPADDENGVVWESGAVSMDMIPGYCLLSYTSEEVADGLQVDLLPKVL